MTSEAQFVQWIDRGIRIQFGSLLTWGIRYTGSCVMWHVCGISVDLNETMHATLMSTINHENNVLVLLLVHRGAVTADNKKAVLSQR